MTRVGQTIQVYFVVPLRKNSSSYSSLPLIRSQQTMEVSAFSTTAKYTATTGSSSLSLTKIGKSQQWHQISFPSYQRTSSQSLSSRIGLLVVPKVNRLKVLSSKKKEIQVLEAESMDEIYDSLAQRLVPTAAVASSPHFKHIVGVAGCPGAGKSTLASEVARRVNKLWTQRGSAMDELVDSPEVAISLPMDGFHLYRNQLDKMEDPKEAHARRGAPWTFDPASLLKCLQKLKTEGSVSMPSFDHGVGDPVEDDIFVSLQHKVVIVEGNYLLLEEGLWKDVSSVFDEKWFVQTDIDTAMQRVFRRLTTETNLSEEIAKWRIENNDRPNAEIVNKSQNNADLVIRSVNFSKSYKEVESFARKQ